MPPPPRIGTEGRGELSIGFGELLPPDGRGALPLLPIGLGLGLLLLPLTKGAMVMGDPLTVTVLVFKDAFGFRFGFGLGLGFEFGFKFRVVVRVGATVRSRVWVGGLIMMGPDITGAKPGPTVGLEVSNEGFSVIVVKPGSWIEKGALEGCETRSSRYD